LILAAAGAAALSAQSQHFDILIAGARVVNGSGSPWFYGYVGIRGDTIAAVGLIPNADATVHIDAKGMVVAPGFIDIHSHGRRGIAEDDVVRIMRSPYAMVGSDGDIPVFGQQAPHPRSYGTFARVLGVYVRDQHVISLEEAVRKVSGFPAQRMKLWDRGLLIPGMKADVIVFDPATVGDRATYDQPHQYSVGVNEVIVNGKLVLHEGKVTAERPGKVLLGPAAR